MKATYGVVNGEEREIFKDPITDNGTKKSARGLLRVTSDENGYKLVDQVERREEVFLNHLRTVFANGIIYQEDSFKTIKDRFEQTL